MSVISLITDFGLKDNFVGVMKAVILKINPQVHIIDISHALEPQDIMEAALMLQSSYNYFPSGTVHLVVVDPGVGSRRKKLLVKTKNYFFVAPDNGVLSMTLKEDAPVKIIEITEQKYFLKPISRTFHGRDIFAPVCAYISKGKPLERFGRTIKSFKDLELPKVKTDTKGLTGEVIHIDHFGNLISNIPKDTLESFIKGKKVKIHIKGKTINKISGSYFKAVRLRPLALIGSSNYLEIALNRGSAKNYFGVDRGTKIKVVRE